MRNLHLTYDWHYLDKIKEKISKKFVAFSEYMNFDITNCCTYATSEGFEPIESKSYSLTEP